MVDGKAVLRDQFRDYTFRGEELEDMNFLDFMLNMYEGDLVIKKRNKKKEGEEATVSTETQVDNNRADHEDQGPIEEGGNDTNGENTTNMARPASERVKYKEGAKKPTRC